MLKIAMELEIKNINKGIPVFRKNVCKLEHRQSITYQSSAQVLTSEIE